MHTCAACEPVIFSRTETIPRFMTAQRNHSAARLPGTSAEPDAQPLRSWLLLALVALFVARPLLPSEGVSWTGDGQPFNFLWLLLAAGYFVLRLNHGSSPRPLIATDYSVAALVALGALSAWIGAK